MSVNVLSPLMYKGENFLDPRQLVSSKNDLLNWNFSETPIPVGFEVYCSGEKKWYCYSNPTTPSSTTGKFTERPTGSSTTIPSSSEVADVSKFFQDNASDPTEEELSGLSGKYLIATVDGVTYPVTYVSSKKYMYYLELDENNSININKVSWE